MPTPAPEKSTRSGNFEVLIPTVKRRGNAANATQSAKGLGMGSGESKRKRGIMEIADSEGDELSGSSLNTQRTRHDEEVARRLQEEFDRDAAEAFLSGSDQGGMEYDMGHDSDDNDSEDKDSVVDPKGKGKAVETGRRRTGRTAAKTVVPDSDDDDEDYSDSVNYEPPAKKLKTSKAKAKGKGKGKANARVPQSDEEDDDDIPGIFLPYTAVD